MVKISESGGVSPIQAIEKPRNEPKNSKPPQETVEEIKDVIQLSEEVKKILDKK